MELIFQTWWEKKNVIGNWTNVNTNNLFWNWITCKICYYVISPLYI